jgi:SAM-dependent methyltransferase
MGLWDSIYSIGAVRKALWRAWYGLLTDRLRAEDVVFLNYAFETEPPMGLPLEAADERERPCAQLYHHVAAQAELAGREVLEVSCGHGGGASYLTRTFRPARYVGLDLNARGVRFCRRRHAGVGGLEFVQGDACRLPFADGSFDVVVNIEASHCYPDFEAFLAEVARVLRPGGHFLYADFRGSAAVEQWERALRSGPWRRVEGREINAEVRRGMELNTPRALALLERNLPRWTWRAGRDFAGTKGSRPHRALERGEWSYRSYLLERAG